MVTCRAFLLVLFFGVFSSVVGQEPTPAPTQPEGSIDAQFNYLITRSRSQDANFKIVRRSNIDIVRRNTLDTINQLKTQVSDLQTANSSTAATAASLQDSIQQLGRSLDAEQAKTDSISFLGMDLDKSSYHLLVWAIIAVLALAFFITFFSYRKAKVDTDEYKRTVDQIQEELQTSKKRAMEREQVLKRQLMDEQLRRNS